MRLFYILLFISLLFSGCTTKEKFAYSIPRIDSTIAVKKISIDNLVKKYKSLHGQYIETEGTYFSAFEEFAIYADKNIFTNEREGFWMEPNMNLMSNDDWLQIDKEQQGKKITIRGKIDTSAHGHLGGYLATIKNIYFFKGE
jgi:hypothetical protein